MKPIPEIEGGLESRIEALGFELVEVRWRGSARRPLLQVRIDRPDSGPGTGVTVDDCAAVSRAVEPWLEGHSEVPERYVLEVSSPGVERPLVRDRDFERFRGERIALRGHDVLAGRSRRLEGELLGLEAGSGSAAIRIRLPDGDEVSVPRDAVAGANLVFTWR